MFARLIKFEFKNLLRDRMTAMLLAYPLMVGFLGKYLFENDTFDENGIRIMIVALSIVSGVIFGCTSSFTVSVGASPHAPRQDTVSTVKSMSSVVCFLLLRPSSFMRASLTGIDLRT